MQTRFPTAVLVLWRAVLGEDLAPALRDLERVLAEPLPVTAGDYGHFVYLGRGWTVGLAHEAALKMRECAQAWSESMPGARLPARADRRRRTRQPGGLARRCRRDLLDDVRATGATVLDPPLDPLARLVLCQRLAVELAAARGLDPDTPRNLTRSVILSHDDPRSPHDRPTPHGRSRDGGPGRARGLLLVDRLDRQHRRG